MTRTDDLDLYDPAPILARQGRRTDRLYAEQLGVDRRTIMRWRRGTRLYRASADAVATALGTHPAVLWPARDPDWTGGEDWMERARCRRSSIPFFGEGSPAVTAAKGICRDCPVRLACGDYALANRIDHGVWGGMSGKERRAVLKARRLAATREAC